MGSVQSFNALNGAVVSREKVISLQADALRDEQPQLAERLQAVLDLETKAGQDFLFQEFEPEIEVVPASLLHCIDCNTDSEAISLKGLGKAVTSDQIYSMITDMMLNTIKEVGHLPWQKAWVGSGIFGARNFVSGKPYTGINFLTLNFNVKYDKDGLPYLVHNPDQKPYYLTFNQIEKLGARLKAGSRGREVVYYNFLLNYKDGDLRFSGTDADKFSEFAKQNKLTPEQVKSNLKRFPILKYYNVFAAEDCEGLTMPKENSREVDRNQYAQFIIDNYPNKPEYRFGSDRAFYVPSRDYVSMPLISAFTKEEYYYSVFFHEIVHSTGHKSRLDRDMSGSKGTDAYANEELIAELGAVFLCAEAGILFQTRDNSAKYLKGWNKRLVDEMTDNNRFFMQAAAAAQKAAKYILDSDNQDRKPFLEPFEKEPKIKGKNVAAKTVKKKPAPRKVKAATNFAKKRPEAQPKTTPQFEELENKIKQQIQRKKNLEKINPKPFSKKPKSVSVATAIGGVLALAKFKDLKPMQAKLLYNIFKDGNDGADIYNPSKFEAGVLKTLPISYAFVSQWEIEIQDKGKELIAAIAGRLASLRNQKFNYALFDGLAGTKKALRGISDPAQLETPMVEDTTQPMAKVTIPDRDVVEGSLADRRKRAKVQHEYYTIPDAEIAEFLGQIEKKQKESVVITLAGDQGSGKTRFLFQMMNTFAQNYKCGHASIEEHPDSALYTDKERTYLNDKALNNIQAPEIENLEQLEKLICKNEIIFIDSFAKLKRMNNRFHLDDDLRKKYDGKLFVVIYQLTGTGTMRGGADSQFDGDVILFTEKCPDYKHSYIYPDKNRYNMTPTDQLKFNIYSGKMVREASQAQEIKTPKPVKFSFDVISK